MKAETQPARRSPRKAGAAPAKAPAKAAAKAAAKTVAGAPRGSSMIELIGLQWRSERPDLDLFEFVLAICVTRLGTMVNRHFGNMTERLFGISGSDMRVLLALRRGGQPYAKRPTDLFRALLVTSGAMTKKVDRLAKLGMVERLADPGNSGGFLVRLTKKGRLAADGAAEQVALESAIAPAMRQFSAAEREAGRDFCVRLLAAMEQTLADDTAEDDEEAPRPARRKKS